MLPVDKFFFNVLYSKKKGYYNSKQPFGKHGDFITAPKVSILFSEIVALWIVLTWQTLGRPNKINIVELGPGDASLAENILNIFKKFPEFNKAKKLFLYEISKSLKNLQKRKLTSKNIKWINNFDKIKDGPVIFFGNEFFDAIPIKQFKRKNKNLFEKYYTVKENFEIKELFRKASAKDIKIINSYKVLKDLRFIEFPKLGLSELDKIVNKISNLNGCLLLIDYGYTKPNNLNTLQSVMKHKKNPILKNLGNADVTHHVNFALLKEFFLKKNLAVEKTITQRQFLIKMGILRRANILSKNMKFSDQANLYLRLKRLLSPKLMGSLFKVILVSKKSFKNKFGFN